MHTPVINQTADHSERWRTEANEPTQHELGQFITPKHVADFMASLFSIERAEVRLLDAGAGSGALTSALVRRLVNGGIKPKRIEVTAYEIDDRIIGRLRQTMAECQLACETVGIQFVSEVRKEDFLDAAASSLRGGLFSTKLPSFNAAIVNPPYRKLRSDSGARLALRSVGIETSNFYTAFVALIIKLLDKSGELVAITPRSFCNGPYFKPFRDLLLDWNSLRQLHLFDSRSAAFGKDKVLQENLIFHSVKGEKQKAHVIISSSSGHPNANVSEFEVPYFEVIVPNDPERFIHVDVGDKDSSRGAVVDRFKATLDDLHLSVSTGRVVDFRSKSFLRKSPGHDTDARTRLGLITCFFRVSDQDTPSRIYTFCASEDF